MGITVYLVYLAIISKCSAQVTENEAKSVTETARTNQEIAWDTTGPSVTVNIKDGRSGFENRPQNELPTNPVFYSNQWQPFLIPNGLSSYIDINNRHRTVNNRPNHHILPTFFRRPDSDLNHTSSNPFTHLSNGFRYHFGPMPMPMAPFNPMFSYPHSPNWYPRRHYDETDMTDVLQNSSNPTRPEISSTEVTSFEDKQENIGAFPLAAVPEVLEKFQPINVFRNRGNFLPPLRHVYLPYPSAPIGNDNSLYPVVFPFVNDPIYDRKTESDVIENISTEQSVSESEVTLNSRDSQKQEVDIANGTPSDTSSNFVPPEPLPLPFSGFPFGVLPSPVFPPIVPGPSTPIANPVEDPVNLFKEAVVSDSALPYLPMPTNNPSLEISQDILIPRDTLKSEGELATVIQTTAEKTVQDNRPSEEKIPYEFGFDMNDGQGTDQHRKEVSDVSGTVRGSYGYRDVFGVYRFVNYIADKNGFRAFIKSNEPGVASSGSANVVVLAEQPPVKTIAEGEKIVDPEPLIVPDTVTDLIAEGSGTKAA